MIDETRKEWLLRRVAEDPDFLTRRYFPAVERALLRASMERDRANREAESLADVKYRQGWLDGALEIASGVLGGMMASDGARKPVSPGFMASILARVGGGTSANPLGGVKAE